MGARDNRCWCCLLFREMRSLYVSTPDISMLSVEVGGVDGISNDGNDDDDDRVYLQRHKRTRIYTTSIPQFPITAPIFSSSFTTPPTHLPLIFTNHERTAHGSSECDNSGPVPAVPNTKR